MAERLFNLGNLLGGSSNAQSGGLMGGGIFSQPESRGQRRSRLLTDAIASAGQNPYARLGASFGGLIGLGGRAAAEGLGIVDAPAEVQRNQAIQQVQQEVAERGLDPMANPVEFGELVSRRFQELGQPELATRTQLQIRQMMPEQQELPAGFRNLALRAEAAGLTPGTRDYAEFMRAGGRQPDAGPSVDVDIDQRTESALQKEFAQQDAKTLSNVSTKGVEADRTIGQINRLSTLLDNAPQGLEGSLKFAAGNFGIPTENLSEIQAAQALINQIVPSQREPGSGPMSDADLELFKQSVPRLINQPGGNKQIIDTMREIAEYDKKGAEIVNRFRADEISRTEAFDQLRNRSNPLENVTFSNE